MTFLAEFFQLKIVEQVLGLFCLFSFAGYLVVDLVEWWKTTEYLPLHNELRHEAVEEGEQQGTDMGSVDIRIG